MGKVSNNSEDMLFVLNRLGYGARAEDYEALQKTTEVFPGFRAGAAFGLFA
jgi:hypothetical protein